MILLLKIVGAYAFLTLFINALIMAFSPKRWFNLPNWICYKGSLSEKKYSTGLGSLQIRIVGIIMSVTFIFLIIDFLFRND